MNTRRFNWIILMVGGLIMVGIGSAGILAGGGTATVPWFALGAGFLVGGLALRRMRLP